MILIFHKFLLEASYRTQEEHGDQYDSHVDVVVHWPVVVVEDLLEVLGNEDEVDTTEAKLWDWKGYKGTVQI